MDNLVLEISKLIGEPINLSLPVPVEISAIADEEIVDPGEKVWVYDAYDTDADEILDINPTTGAITIVKRTPMVDTELTFKGLQSPLEYVLATAVLGSPDTQVLGRKKERISQAMDKLELRCILNAIVDGKTPGMTGGTAVLEDSVQSPSLASGDDLYDVIIKMKHLVEDYGDQYLFLAGSTIKEKIDTYNKDYASTFQYNVDMPVTLKNLGIDVLKIFGTVKWTGGLHNVGAGGYADDSGVTALLNATKAVLIARNSRVASGKPIKFVRRRIPADMAKLMGADVDKAQRALLVNPMPINNAGVPTAGYGVYALESIIWAITNPNSIVKSGDLTSYLA